MRPCYNCRRFHPAKDRTDGVIGGCDGLGIQYDFNPDVHIVLESCGMRYEAYGLECPLFDRTVAR